MFGFAYLFTAVILWLKLISYAHCNRDLRLAWRERALAAKEKEKKGAQRGGSGGRGDGEEGAWRGGGGTTGGWSVEGFSDAEGTGGEQQVGREERTRKRGGGGGGYDGRSVLGAGATNVLVARRPLCRRSLEVWSRVAIGCSRVVLSSFPGKWSEFRLPPLGRLGPFSLYLSLHVVGASPLRHPHRASRTRRLYVNRPQKPNLPPQSNHAPRRTQSHRDKASSSSAAGGGGGGVSGGDDESNTRTQYPGNIGVLDLLYFWFAPTLCYQPDYPRSKKVRRSNHRYTSQPH